MEEQQRMRNPPLTETDNLLTGEAVWMLVTGALMFRRSQTLTDRSSDPETIWSDRLKKAQVTESVWPLRKKDQDSDRIRTLTVQFSHTFPATMLHLD